jgi:uncharacterized membrane protein YjdF
MTLLRSHTLILFGLLLLLILLLSGIHPYDRPTWLMDVAPILIAGPVLVVTCPRASNSLRVNGDWLRRCLSPRI